MSRLSLLVLELNGEVGKLRKPVLFIPVFLVVFALIAVVGAQKSSAKVDYMSQIPSDLEKSCNLCHTSSIPALNQFGQDWIKAGKNFDALKKTEPPKPAEQPKAEDAKPETPKAPVAPAAETAAKQPEKAAPSATRTVAPAYVQRNVQVAVGAKTQSVKAIIDNGRTLAPIRSLSELLGASVDWDNARKAASISSGSKVLVVHANKSVVQINGADIKLDVSVRFVNNITYAPLRFVAESLGASVGYNAKTGDITISLSGGATTLPSSAQSTQPAASSQVLPQGSNKSLALPGYVGSQTCGGCHQATYKGWQGTRHARMLQDAKDPNAWIIGDFSTNTYFMRSEVLYSVGNGLEGSQRYVGLKDGKLTYLPAQWDVVSHSWKSYNSSPYTCAGCHTAGYNDKTGYWSENGITCESCHGPGAEHANTADKTKIKASTGLEMCSSCHDAGRQGEALSKMWIPEGEEKTGGHISLFANQIDAPRGPDYHYGTGCLECHSATFILAEEKGIELTYDDFVTGAYKDDRNGITCVVCHEPHKNTANKYQLREGPQETCLRCHDEPWRHADGTVSAKGGPIYKTDGTQEFVGLSKKAECVDCHMNNGSHTFTPGVEAITSKGTTTTYNACAKCHTQFGPESDRSETGIDPVLTARIKDGQARWKAVQASINGQYTLLKARQDSVQAKFDTLKKAEPDSRAVKEAEPYINASLNNIRVLKEDGSWGIHNMNYTRTALADLEEQLKTVENILK